MKNTLKIWGLLLMSLILVTSCGEKKGNTDKSNVDEVETVKEMLETATWIAYVKETNVNYDSKTIKNKESLERLKELVTKGKTYKKITPQESMSDEQYGELEARKYHLQFFQGSSWKDHNNLLFAISEDGQKVTVLTLKRQKGFYFELEGNIDVSKIEAIIHNTPSKK